MEEVEALRAIFCSPGEVEVISTDSPLMFSVNLNMNNVQVLVVFTLKHTYPDALPDVSIRTPVLSKTTAETLKKDITSLCDALKGQPMLMDIIMWIQDNADKYFTRDTGQRTSVCLMEDVQLNHEKENCIQHQQHGKQNSWICVTKIDHMRAKGKYVKTIMKWIHDLNLLGCLIFYGRLILLVLQGDIQSVKNYVVRHKTSTVDVDSRGLPCKEKMMSVLAEVQLNSQTIGFADFVVFECGSWSDIVKIFTDRKLQTLYDSTIHPLKRT